MLAGPGPGLGLGLGLRRRVVWRVVSASANESVTQSASVEPWAYSTELGAASRYMTEGVDQLDDSPIVQAYLTADRRGWTLDATLIQGLDRTYTEYELGGSYGAALGRYAGSLRLAYIDQQPETAHDWEWTATVSRAIGAGALELAYVESVRGTGGLATLRASASVGTYANWAWDTAVTQFYDFGYVNDTGQGANHVELELGAEYDLYRIALLGSVPQRLLRDAGEPGRVWVVALRRF